MKWNYYDYVDTLRGRTPRGVRGLKSCVVECGPSGRLSHPSRGAWIEIALLVVSTNCERSHPSRGAWIEIPG